MDLRQFYESILPPTGRYVLFQNKGHFFCDTIDELLAETERRINTQGLYFATASYGDEDYRTQDNVLLLNAHRVDIDAGADKFAKDPEGTYETRDDALAALLSAIRKGFPKPSIIVGSGAGLHVYWTLDEAVDRLTWKLTAKLLNAAGKALGLKIDVVCTADEARVLRPIGTLHKSGERVRIIKATDAVYDHTDLSLTLRALVPADMMPRPETPKGQPKVRSLNDDILEIKSPPASLERVAEHCAAVAEMRDKEGNVPEPLWRAVMGVAKYCEVDGEALVHEWSEGYPGYNERATQTKFDRWETPPTTCDYFRGISAKCAGCKYKVTTPKMLGYVTAERLATVADAPVEQPLPLVSTLGGGMALPDDDEDNSPSVSFALAGDATPECPVPERKDLFDETKAFFYRAKNGRWTLWHSFTVFKKDATGAMVGTTHTRPVCHRLIWADSSSDVGASDTGGVLVTFGRISRAGTTLATRFDMPAGMVSDTGAVLKFMYDQGVNIEPSNSDAHLHLRKYIQQEINYRQDDMRFVIKSRFGPHIHEDDLIYCHGPFTVYPDGKIVKTVCNSSLSVIASAMTPSCLPPRETPVWGGDDWDVIEAAATDYCNFIRKHYYHDGYEKARLALAITLASPFMVFAGDNMFRPTEALPSNGFVVSLYSSSSGVGKTALEDVICAAYGNSSLRMSGKRSLMTEISGYAAAQNLGVYPFVLDEVTQNEATTVINMVESFANGQGRVRADQTGALQKSVKTWSLVTCVSTNMPQRELVSSKQNAADPIQMRILELDFTDLPMVGDREAFRREYRDLTNKSGAFGLLQARYITAFGVEKLTALIEKNLAAATKLLNLPQPYRYFIRALAIAMTNIQIMTKMGFCPFEEGDVIETFQKAMSGTQGYMADQERSAQDVLAQLILAASPSIAVTQTYTKRTAHGTGGDVLLNANVREPLVGREVREWSQIMIDRVFIHKWCAENQISITSLMPKLLDDGLLILDEGKRTARKRLSLGLSNKTNVTAHCYTFRTASGIEETNNALDKVTQLHQAPAEPIVKPDSVKQDATESGS